MLRQSALTVALVLVSACTREAAATKADAALAEVHTAQVTTGAYTPETSLDGSLDPVASVQLGFDVPGRIEKLLVKRGDVVSKGRVLATLDDGMARAQAAQADAAVSGAEAQLAAGEAGWAKAQQLHTAGGMSDQQFKDAEAGILSGRAGVEQAKAAQLLAHTHLANHALKAPISGTISNCPDNAGMMVGAGTPLFLLEDLSTLQLKGSVGEEAGWVAAGMMAEVKPGTPGSTETAQATVVRVLSALDPMTRRLPVELSLSPTSSAFRAHGYARATIRASQAVDALSVPSAAVVARPDLSVVVQRGATYVRVPVRVLQELGETTLIAGELTAGEAIVLYPASGLGGEG